ncbi:MAG: arylsulfatase [Anaerolineae bacterium]|nr:arylsulfatase [Anaerolineae bacterium]
MATSPNIIFIMADDMGYGDVGAFNPDSRILTPNMDRLAAEGMVFTDAHSASSVCTPSRYGVLTGRYCWRTRLKSGVNGGYSLPLIDPSRLTVASLLKRHGYATAAVGKWHVGLEWQAEDGSDFDRESWEDTGAVDYSKPIIGGPLSLGFDTFFGIAGSLDMPPYCFIEDDHVVGIPSVEKSPYNPQQRRGPMTPGWRDEDCDPTFLRKAVSFIERSVAEDAQRPFFLYLTPAAPHRPCMPPDFAKGKSQAGPRGDAVWLVDWMVGEVMKTLERLGQVENTLVIVTSDNGARPCDVDGLMHDHKSCGDLRGYKGDIWEGGHREPFIVRWPAVVEAGSVCDATVCLGDFLATCAEIVGETLPPNAAEDSFSLVPLLAEGEAVFEHGAVVHHSLAGMFSVRQGRWKLIMGLGSGGFSEPRFGYSAMPDAPKGQLYDMVDDWREQHNLWNERPEIVARLKQLIVDYRESGRSAPLPTL